MIKFHFSLAAFLICLSVAGCDDQSADRNEVAPRTQISAEQESAIRRARAEYRARNFEAAYREMMPAAEAGVAYAQYYVGFLLHQGRGVGRDDDEAYRWLLKAAEQGLAHAQYQLAQNVYYGHGAPAEMDQHDQFKAAAHWFRTAAEQGHGPAHNWLGELYLMGRGVPESVTEAAKWFERGAALGDPESLSSLAGLQRGGGYSESAIVPIDDEAATQNYLRAARSGNGEAARGLLSLYEEGRTSVPFSEILQLLEQAALHGDHFMQSDLVAMYLEGRLVDRNPSRAAYWLEQLTEIGFSREYASFVLAELYLSGDGVPKDIARAAELLLVAAERDGHSPVVSLRLSGFYETGEGLPRDYARAYYWANRALNAPTNRNEDSSADIALANEAISRLEGLMTMQQIVDAQRLFVADDERRARASEDYQRSRVERWQTEDAAGDAQ